MANMDLEKLKPTDSCLEYMDPTPSVYDLFNSFNKRYFWDKLGMVVVKWSNSMTKCAGLCSYQGESGLCCIKLSAPLLILRPRKDLVETLLHEMIHAYLFVTQSYNDREDHGPQFLSHMHRINSEAGTNIKIHHHFHTEVAFYKTHLWRCTGNCRYSAPYFGFVRVAMNDEPGPSDPWWASHLVRCGGQFVRVPDAGKMPQNKRRKAKKQGDTLKGMDNRDYLISYDTHTSISNRDKRNRSIISSASAPEPEDRDDPPSNRGGIDHPSVAAGAIPEDISSEESEEYEESEEQPYILPHHVMTADKATEISSGLVSVALDKSCQTSLSLPTTDKSTETTISIPINVTFEDRSPELLSLLTRGTLSDTETPNVTVVEATNGGECSKTSEQATDGGECSKASEQATDGGECSKASEQATDGGECSKASEQATDGGECSQVSEQATDAGECSQVSEQAADGGECSQVSEQATDAGECSKASEQATGDEKDSRDFYESLAIPGTSRSFNPNIETASTAEGSSQDENPDRSGLKRINPYYFLLDDPKWDSLKKRIMTCPVCLRGVLDDFINEHTNNCLDELTKPSTDDVIDVSGGSAAEESDHSELVSCPICGDGIEPDLLIEHVDACFNSTFVTEATASYDEPDVDRVICPCCKKWVKEKSVNEHIDQCLTLKSIKNSIGSL